MKQYYIVRDVTDAKQGVSVATGVVPATSPTLEDGTVTEGTYNLYKVTNQDAPTGASVVELTDDEARLVVQGSLFNGGSPTTDYVMCELRFCSEVRALFMKAQSGLGLLNAEALLTALEGTSIALSAGSPNLAYSRFNDAAVPQATKDAFNPLFDRHFSLYPRDFTA